jgi:hypothetical protein
MTSAVAVTATLYVLFAARYNLGGSDSRKGKRADSDDEDIALTLT